MTGVVKLRPVRPGDQGLLFRVFAGARDEELAAVPWDDAQKDAFLRAQFNAQAQWYRQHYTGASYNVIEIDDEPCGRLYVYRGDAEIRIMEIALLPAHRGNGVGSSLLRDVIREADTDGKRVSVHVERFNPALRLYESLGFSVAEDNGVYVLLERAPVR
jgi:ribosomal protein S18 acetylase RimI-like enzyme